MCTSNSKTKSPRQEGPRGSCSPCSPSWWAPYSARDPATKKNHGNNHGSAHGCTHMQASIHTPRNSKTICLQPCLVLTKCYITHKGSSLGLSLQGAIRKLQLSKMIHTSSSMTFLFIVLIWGLQNGSRVKVIATKVNNLRLIPGADMVEGDKQFLQLSFDYHTYSVVPTHPCPHTHMHKCTHTKCNKINCFPF